ncbi:MAG: SAM-dependent methyltransferase [Pirellulaceae bacterium]|nr:MAG: SAM-dependent methyltransferase [Pirellulaceae bacterium]
MVRRPVWQLPPGVHGGTWDYVNSPQIANDYDQYFRDHPLLQLDVAFLQEHLPPAGGADPPIIVDLGCGSARLAAHFVPRGYRFVNVDLSTAMLRVATAKLVDHREEVCSLRANMVQLGCLRADSVDGVACMFSSLGMIRGRSNRRAVLAHCRRILRPGCPLIVHVHHLLRDLWEPGGWRRLAGALQERLRGAATEIGDIVYCYRGIPRMFMHRFLRGELAADLRVAGFASAEFFPIDPTACQVASSRSRWRCWFAGGFFVVARAPQARLK